MNLIKDFEPLLKSEATKLSKLWGIDKKDLIQEGYVRLLELEVKFPFMFEWEPAERTKYIKLAVMGAMRNYIAAMKGPISVQKDTFFKGEYKRPPVEDVSTIIDSEEIMIQKEALLTLEEQVRKFCKTLSHNEYIVFYNWIYTDNQKSMRYIAETIGVKSPNAVHRIKNNLIKRWRKKYGTDLQSICSKKNS
jgi:DNA-directed RNA polymerase specialized sigma subunit